MPNHTVQIIIQNCYNDQNKPPSDTPKKIFKELLEMCKKEAPFKFPDGKLYK